MRHIWYALFTTLQPHARFPAHISQVRITKTWSFSCLAKPWGADASAVKMRTPGNASAGIDMAARTKLKSRQFKTLNKLRCIDVSVAIYLMQFIASRLWWVAFVDSNIISVWICGEFWSCTYIVVSALWWLTTNELDYNTWSVVDYITHITQWQLQ